MKNYYYYIEKAMRGELDTSYEMTMPLIVTALQPHSYKAEYLEVKRKTLGMIRKESAEIGGIEGKMSWLLGRVLYANKISKREDPFDVLTLDPAKHYLNSRSAPYSNYEAWAIGYYSILNSFYDSKKTKFIEIANSCNNLSDRLWAYNLYLSAAAYHDDKETYNQIREALLKNSGKMSLCQAAHEIPINDFRGWALGLNLVSETKMKCEGSVQKEFLEAIDVIVKMKEANPHDAALAESYLVYHKENFGSPLSF